MQKYLPYKIIISILLILSISLIFWSTDRVGPQDLKVSFIDVGQGDSILIETPNNFQILVDAGRSGSISRKLSDILGRSDKIIDIAIATHPDADHIGGFNTLFDKFDINYFIKTKWEATTRSAKIVEEKSNSGDTKVITIDHPSFLEFDGVKLYFLWPFDDSAVGDTNAMSIILLVEYMGSTLLLTGDAPYRVEEMVAQNFPDLIDVDLLKAGHHGSKTSSSLSFLQSTTPEFFVVSASANNSYGHPHQSVIDNAEKINTKIFQTGKAGNIVFIAKNKTFIHSQ